MFSSKLFRLFIVQYMMCVDCLLIIVLYKKFTRLDIPDVSFVFINDGTKRSIQSLLSIDHERCESSLTQLLLKVG